MFVLLIIKPILEISFGVGVDFNFVGRLCACSNFIGDKIVYWQRFDFLWCL